MKLKKVYALMALISAATIVATTSAYAQPSRVEPQIANKIAIARSESDRRPPIDIRTRKKAMTWRILAEQPGDAGKMLYRFGSDDRTNPYQGDTNISEVANLLCIAKADLPQPASLPKPHTTPGGALRNSWSGGYAFVQFDVRGRDLPSKQAADDLCNTLGQQAGIAGARMAEFHDGDQNAGWAGWDFWADGSFVPSSKKGGPSLSERRFWVFINDQPNGNIWR